MNIEYFTTDYLQISLLSIAIIIDFIIGDPEYRFHPIRLIGNLIIKLEMPIRKITKNQKFNGFILWFAVVGFSYLVGSLFVSLGIPFELFLIYSSIAVGDLRKKSFEIKKLLKYEEIDKARKKVGFIVGRDTENLNKKEIIRAVVETVAENIVDGIIAPIVFFFIGGAPMMFAYKAINTLDSMVGYKNERYIEFGKVSAKIDDIANFIPARISIIIINLAGVFSLKNFVNGIKIGLRDGKKNPSPNSGISEAVVAGLFSIQLGGDNYYFGKLSRKPLIGDDKRELDIKHINDVIILAYLSAIITTIFGGIVYF